MKDIARKIKVIITDVDGVLTDGGLYYSEEGLLLKKFNVQDGLGIKLAQMANIEVIVITGLKSQAVRERITELGITEFYEGKIKKRDIIKKISKEKNIKFEEMAYIGDDWVDGPPMKMVGLPMAVKNAQPEIKALAKWISSKNGGEGAVREAINFILREQGKLETLWEKWINQDF